MVQKKRSRIREAKQILFDEMLVAYDTHLCDEYRIGRSTLCLLCNAWQHRLAFACYELLKTAGALSQLAEREYTELCKFFPTARIADLTEREKHKMLNLPWITCPGCRVPSPINTWSPLRESRRSCPNCGYRVVVEDSYLQKLYNKQKTLFQKERKKKQNG